ncbi:hypothetical protein [Halanaerobacter jeridensis]|uniref:Uncharacterized protein YutE (UPF0331/DUF86 family) n=1 Tax=Halanaerobacter jeridensis TaxID=706427 RepID=A0A939BQJ1_9FIRM|nr:hypothetical protein [Halanaerobacter jeridensis]MBM7558233.1 uncharacterized protein YutE (UPF0331/DUF86 family) [Halanaerobacter jeridensis]
MNKHIKIHSEIIKQALELMEYNERESTIVFKGKILKIMHSNIWENKDCEISENEDLFSYIIGDIWNIANLVQRLNWLRNIAMDNDNNFWHTYASLDIEHIYVEFRSLCDHLAKLIYYCYDEIPSSRGESFYKLLKWVFENRENANVDLVEVFRNSNLLREEEEIYKTWFGHMREIRDDINHRGAEAIVFANPSDGIIFQVLRWKFNDIVAALPHISFNENDLIYFRKYFSLQMASLLLFTEDLANIIIDKFQLEVFNSYSTGFDIIHKWMEGFHEELISDY